MPYNNLRDTEMFCINLSESTIIDYTFILQRNNTKNSKQIFPEKELCGLSPNFHIHVSVSDIYIPAIGLSILLQETMWTDPGNIYINRSQTHEFGNWD